MRPSASWAIDSEPIRAREIIVNYHFHAARRSRRVAFQSLRLFYRKTTKRLRRSGYFLQLTKVVD